MILQAPNISLQRTAPCGLAAELGSFGVGKTLSLAVILTLTGALTGCASAPVRVASKAEATKKLHLERRCGGMFIQPGQATNSWRMEIDSNGLALLFSDGQPVAVGRYLGRVELGAAQDVFSAFEAVRPQMPQIWSCPGDSFEVFDGQLFTNACIVGMDKSYLRDMYLVALRVLQTTHWEADEKHAEAR